ncbi:hypothetical protein [Nocardioides xinjiangensis]|uniref:hypothetical protein n=1 Tax=Nocardioides xinjiangensis TaxID=2817376 RepID=UPI001B30FCE7|nr:hypothetical protein [Nocardioides sp. SYSU D00514]
MSDDAFRELARRLLGKPDADSPPAEEPLSGNYSPRGGFAPPRLHDPMREFIRDLFTTND